MPPLDTPPFTLALTEHGLLQLSNVHTSEDLAAALRRYADAHDAAVADAHDQTEAITRVLAAHDPAHVLASLTIQNSFADPETFKEYEHDGSDAFTEYAALVYLTRPRAEWTAPPDAVLDAETYAEIGVRTRQLFRATTFALGTAAINRDDPQPVEPFEVLRASAVGRTMVVRAAAYPHHLDQTVRGTLSPVDDLLREHLGFTTDQAVRLARAVVALADRGFEANQQTFHAELAEGRNAIEAYRRDGAVPADAAPEAVAHYAAMDDAELEPYLLGAASHAANLQLASHFAFTTEGLADEASVPAEVAAAFAARFSLGFGDVDPAHYTRPSAAHPLLTRPLVRFEPGEGPLDRECFVCPAPRAVPWAVRPNVEAALNPASDDALASATNETWDRCDRSRSGYVERRTMELLGTLLPGAVAETSLGYDAPDATGTVGPTELDGLLRLDNALFLVEAKAGSLGPASRRGAHRSLRSDLKSLVREAHGQALRARTYIEAHDAPAFRRGDGSTFTLDRAGLRRTFLVGVTLEPLDAFVTNLAHLDELGLLADTSPDDREGTDLPWSVSLYDLEVCADLLSGPGEFVHYFRRRLRLNKLGWADAPEELDWLGRYLHAGLDFARPYVDDRPLGVRLLTHTTDLDDYYAHALGGRQTPAPKPVQPLPEPMDQMIADLESVRPAGFLDMVGTLLDIPTDKRLCPQTCGAYLLIEGLGVGSCPSLVPTRSAPRASAPLRPGPLQSRPRGGAAQPLRLPGESGAGVFRRVPRHGGRRGGQSDQQGQHCRQRRRRGQPRHKDAFKPALRRVQRREVSPVPHVGPRQGPG